MNNVYKKPVYILRIPYNNPTDIPISTYNKVQATGNTQAGGDRGECNNDGYHSAIASP